MKLISLTLENIKSYIKETIAFFDGVNFVSGSNGAGKTTIIEAIGYALFDASPFTVQRQFIREGQKSGTITVILEAADERIYRVVRRLRLPAGGSWAVYDEESGMELNELHGNPDVKAWLAANLNMTGGLNPTLLFEDVIGISQGSFTSPFLEKAKDRKNTFNKILQLDSYREAFEKTSGLDAVFSKSIGDKEGDKKGLLVRAEGWESCKAELTVNRERIEVLGQELQAVKGEIKVVDLQIEEQEKLKTLVDIKEKELHNLDVRLEGLRVRQERLAKDLQEAALCKEKVEAAKAGYLAYSKLQDKQKELETKRKLRDALIIEQQAQKTAIASLTAQLQSETQNRNCQLKDGETELKELLAEGEKAAAERKDAVIKKTAAEEDKAKLSGQEEILGYPQQALSCAKQGKAVIEALIGNYQQLLNEKEKLVRLLSCEAELALAAQSLPRIELELRQIGEELSRANGKMASLEENRKATDKGVCPFFETPCPNIEGSLDDYFTTEIEKLMPTVLGLRLQSEELEARLVQSRKAREDYNMLLRYREQLEQVLQQIQKSELALDRENNELRKVLDTKNLKAFEHSIVEIGAKDVLIKIIHEYDKQCKRVFTDTADTEPPQSGNYLGPMSAIVDGLEALTGQLELIRDQSSIIRNNADALMNRSLQEAGGRLAAIEDRLGSLRERYRKLSAVLQMIRQDDGLEKLELKLKEKERELAGTVEKLLQYSNLEEEWEENKKVGGKLEPDYIIYMQNIEGAGKIPLLRQVEREMLGEEQSLSAEVQRQKSMLQQLKTQYAEETLSSARQQRERLVEDRAKKEADLEYAGREALRYEKLLNEKELVLREIAVLDIKIEKEEKAREMLRLVRVTLNQSGEKMAQVYRQYIGREADLIYQQIAAENVHLFWADDYEIKIIDRPDSNVRERIFGQLSGGEKMTAALAIRLALLKQLSGLGIGFFDEPTANLDEKRRGNLARIIPEITRNFNQVFVISHDDSFDAITENVIALKKDINKGSIVVNAWEMTEGSG